MLQESDVQYLGTVLRQCTELANCLCDSTTSASPLRFSLTPHQSVQLSHELTHLVVTTTYRLMQHMTGLDSVQQFCSSHPHDSALHISGGLLSVFNELAARLSQSCLEPLSRLNSLQLPVAGQGNQDERMYESKSV